MAFCCCNTKLGKIYIAERDNHIVRLAFSYNALFDTEEQVNTPLLENACAQINEYFAGQRKSFNLPLAPQGTVFQKQVWRALCLIPYGQTVSYKYIAQQIGKPRAYRAVGLANNKNPIPILIPCHRVIGSNGKLIGYAGGLALKNKLLNIETRNL